MVKDPFILLVEDNPDEVILTQRAFAKTRITHELIVVSDGRQALDFLFSQGEYSGRDHLFLPRLILLDLKLPLIGGLEVLNAIRTNPHTSKIPVVVLTSSTEDRDISESYRLGANDFKNKPTGFTEFVNIMTTIKTQWLDPHSTSGLT
jgi:two-component system, response regulator